MVPACWPRAARATGRSTMRRVFAVGERVRTKNFNPETHTRLPRYARAKTGVVEAVQGSFVFPDDNAHGKGENPQWVYTVVFDGGEIWGEGADPSLTVSIDAWESYLERGMRPRRSRNRPDCRNRRRAIRSLPSPGRRKPSP